jgi:emp24/gp25L/p24 family/GOLD
MSTFQEKFLDFDITIEHEVVRGWIKSDLESAVGSISKPKVDKEVAKSLEVLENSLKSVSYTLTNLYKSQRKVRSDEHRNGYTLDQTQSRIFYFAILECLGIVG